MSLKGIKEMATSTSVVWSTIRATWMLCAVPVLPSCRAGGGGGGEGEGVGDWTGVSPLLTPQ